MHIKSPFVRRILACIFIGMNILILVEGGLLTAKNKIPRYWWPAISGIIVGASFVYWGGFRILMLRNPTGIRRSKHKNVSRGRTVDSEEEIPEETVAQALFGVNIKVTYEDSQEYYQDDIEDSTCGLIDGSRRRVSYTVSLNSPNLHVISPQWLMLFSLFISIVD